MTVFYLFSVVSDSIILLSGSVSFVICGNAKSDAKSCFYSKWLCMCHSVDKIVPVALLE